MTDRKFGWLPDVPDQRDFKFVPTLAAVDLPPKVSLMAMCPPVYNQGDLGSCTANAACAAVQFTEKEVAQTKRPVPSRLFTYYFTRTLQGTADVDSGASIRATMKSLAKWGYCPETKWPYKVDLFRTPPPTTAVASASKHRLSLNVHYAYVTQRLGDLRAAIAEKNPIVFGFSVYENFESGGKSGLVPMPGKNDAVLGGHAMLLVGYDDQNQHFLARNSWGTGFGEKGYCYLPYKFITNANISSDFWVVKAVPKIEP